MDNNKFHFKGKSISTIFLLSVVASVVTIYLTGIPLDQSLWSTVFLSSLWIGGYLFLFLSYGLYLGVGIEDDFPTFTELHNFLDHSLGIDFLIFSDLDLSDGPLGFVLSLLTTILYYLIYGVFATLFWGLVALVIVFVYSLFFKGLQLVFGFSDRTKDNLLLSIPCAFGFTLCYVGLPLLLTRLVK